MGELVKVRLFSDTTKQAEIYVPKKCTWESITSVIALRLGLKDASGIQYLILCNRENYPIGDVVTDMEALWGVFWHYRPDEDMAFLVRTDERAVVSSVTNTPTIENSSMFHQSLASLMANMDNQNQLWSHFGLPGRPEDQPENDTSNATEGHANNVHDIESGIISHAKEIINGHQNVSENQNMNRWQPQDMNKKYPNKEIEIDDPKVATEIDEQRKRNEALALERLRLQQMRQRALAEDVEKERVHLDLPIRNMNIEDNNNNNKYTKLINNNNYPLPNLDANDSRRIIMSSIPSKSAEEIEEAARQEARRKSIQEAESRRLTELETKRIAAEEAEKRRLLEEASEARRLLQESRRKAAEESEARRMAEEMEKKLRMEDLENKRHIDIKEKQLQVEETKSYPQRSQPSDTQTARQQISSSPPKSPETPSQHAKHISYTSTTEIVPTDQRGGGIPHQEVSASLTTPSKQSTTITHQQSYEAAANQPVTSSTPTNVPLSPDRSIDTTSSSAAGAGAASGTLKPVRLRLDSSNKQEANISVTNDCRWNDLKDHISKALQLKTSESIQTLVLLDEEGDETSCAINDESKFWKFYSRRYKPDEGMLFLVRYDVSIETAFEAKEEARLAQEAEEQRKKAEEQARERIRQQELRKKALQDEADARKQQEVARNNANASGNQAINPVSNSRGQSGSGGGGDDSDCDLDELMEQRQKAEALARQRLEEINKRLSADGKKTLPQSPARHASIPPTAASTALPNSMTMASPSTDSLVPPLTMPSIILEPTKPVTYNNNNNIPSSNEKHIPISAEKRILVNFRLVTDSATSFQKVALFAEASWDNIISILSSHFRLDPSISIEHIALIDEDGDDVFGIISASARFWKAFNTRYRADTMVFIAHTVSSPITSVASTVTDSIASPSLIQQQQQYAPEKTSIQYDGSQSHSQGSIASVSSMDGSDNGYPRVNSHSNMEPQYLPEIPSPQLYGSTLPSTSNIHPYDNQQGVYGQPHLPPPQQPQPPPPQSSYQYQQQFNPSDDYHNYRSTQSEIIYQNNSSQVSSHHPNAPYQSLPGSYHHHQPQQIPNQTFNQPYGDVQPVVGSIPPAPLPAQEPWNQNAPVPMAPNPHTPGSFPAIPPPNVTDPNMITSFLKACSDGDLNTAKHLVSLGIDVNAKDAVGLTAMHVVSMMGRQDVAQWLLQQGASYCPRDKEGMTPLHYACDNKHVSLALFLVRNGADSSLRNKAGITSLHIVCIRGVMQLMVLIRDYMINVATGSGLTLLHCAADQGHDDVVKHLLSHGAHVHARDDEGMTPLHLACMAGHITVCMSLLEGGAYWNTRDDEGMSPLLYACQEGHLNLIYMLLENDANIHVRNNGGATALHLACESGNLEVVTFLVLKRRLEVNAKAKNGTTPIQIAQNAGAQEIVAFLSTHGAGGKPESDTEAALRVQVEEKAEAAIRAFEAEEEGNLKLEQASQMGLTPQVSMPPPSPPPSNQHQSSTNRGGEGGRWFR